MFKMMNLKLLRLIHTCRSKSSTKSMCRWTCNTRN